MLGMLLAAAANLSPGPSLSAAEPRSIAYRECVAAERRRRPAASVAEIGRGACAGARSKLVSAVRSRIGYGWSAAPKTDAQARRMRAQLDRSAADMVARFEEDLQAWLTATSSSPANAGVQTSGRTGSRPLRRRLRRRSGHASPGNE